LTKITFVPHADSVRDMVTVNPADETDPANPNPEWQAERFRFFPVTDERLQLFEIHLAPGTEVHPHAHAEDEIIAVIEGEIHVGKRVLPAGSAVYVEKESLYAFKAGPTGAVFLNFRPGWNAGYIAKRDLLAHRAASRAAAGT
jgi:quercetin dioxygenase-like cupin family protein